MGRGGNQFLSRWGRMLLLWLCLSGLQNTWAKELQIRNAEDWTLAGYTISKGDRPTQHLNTPGQYKKGANDAVWTWEILQPDAYYHFRDAGGLPFVTTTPVANGKVYDVEAWVPRSKGPVGGGHEPLLLILGAGGVLAGFCAVATFLFFRVPQKYRRIPGCRYAILHNCNAGGLGETYFVKRHMRGHWFVLKRLRQVHIGKAKFVQAFRFECDVLQWLAQAGYVHSPKLIEMGGLLAGNNQAPEAWYVMTRVPGDPLEDVISLIQHAPKRYPLKLRLLVAHAVAAAVAELHALGVAHRDLSPNNIFIQRASSHPRAVLIDFGSARMPDMEANPLQADRILKEAYAPPEQFAGLAKATMPADNYALGMVICEVILGAHPFHTPGKRTSMEEQLTFDRHGLQYRLIRKGLDAKVARYLCERMLQAREWNRGTAAKCQRRLEMAYPALLGRGSS